MVVKQFFVDKVAFVFVAAAYVALVAIEVVSFLLPFAALVAMVAMICRMFRSP